MIHHDAKEFQSWLFFQGEPTKRNSTRPSSFAQQITSSPRSAINHQLEKSESSLQTSSDHRRKSMYAGEIWIFDQKIVIDYESQHSVLEAIAKIQQSPRITQRTSLALQMVVLSRGQEANHKLEVLFKSIIGKYERELQDIVK